VNKKTSKKVSKKNSFDISTISVDDMDKELSKIIKKPIVALKIGDITVSFEIPKNPITKKLQEYSTKTRTIVELSKMIKIGVDFK
jgi:hypothetical protein